MLKCTSAHDRVEWEGRPKLRASTYEGGIRKEHNVNPDGRRSDIPYITPDYEYKIILVHPYRFSSSADGTLYGPLVTISISFFASAPCPSPLLNPSPSFKDQLQPSPSTAITVK
jgi:hypothetical protein